MQLGWVYSDPFFQLTNLNSPEEVVKLRQALPQGTTIYKYALMDELQRKAILSNCFEWNPEQYSEHLKCLEALPLIKVTMTAEVKGESCVANGDILSCKLRVDYLNLKKG